MKAFIKFFSGILLSLAALSCDVGLGSEVDVEAPVINITSHKQNDYVPLKFTLSGTFTDNQGLNRVYVSYNYKQVSTEETATNYKEVNASISGQTSGTWNCELEFPCNQEVVLSVYAVDSMKNESVYSKDTVTLVVDTEAPSIGTITITKDSDFSVQAISIERFLGDTGKTACKTDSSNKDYFHNENVIISTNVSENYEVQSAKLNLYEISDYDLTAKTYTKNLIAEGIACDTTKNLFNPKWTITQTQLTQWNSSLATGLHYILPEIVITDGAGTQNVYNSTQVNVFAWEAEYDTPHLTIYASRKNGKIRIPQETPMTVKIFDDDGLKSYKWTLAKTTGEADYKRSGEADVSSKKIRDDNFEISTTGLPDGNYTLTVEITDYNPLVSARTSVVQNHVEDIKITNANAATVNITAPEYNTSPALSGSNKSEFTLAGEVIDNAAVENIAVAWCRPGATQTDAENYFETFDFEGTTKSSTNAIISSDGKLKIWNIGNNGTSGTTTVTSTFTKTFDIFTDFTDASGNIVNETKIFAVSVMDATGNITTEIHRVGAYKSLPTFAISMSDSLNGTYTSTTQTTVSAEPDKAIYVKIKPSCDLPVTAFKAGTEGNEKDCLSDITDGTVCTISKDDAQSDTKVKLVYSAADKFGNSNSGSFTVQFEKIPAITDILCKEEGSTLKAGSTLHFQVTFDKSVTVTGTPQIVLDCFTNEGDTTSAGTLTADYASGSDSATLIFTKTISESVEYKKLSIKKDSGNWITLNGGAIKRSTMNAILNSSVTQSSYTLTIDSKNPELKTFGGQRTGTTANFSRKSSTDTSVDILLNFSEPVTNKNGNITIYRKGSEDVTSGEHTWHIPAVIGADEFEKIWNNSTDANRIVLSSSSTEKSVNADGTLVSKGPYKMYTNGLKKNETAIYQYEVSSGNAVKGSTVIAAAGTVMVPDLTTKYVLDYPYDTASTTDATVKNIRAALEAVGYHKTTIALSRLTFSDDRKTATLNVKDSDFTDGIHDGVEYIMTVPAGSFVDDVQNATAAASTYTFTVGKTAAPVLRVNRWSTNSSTALDPNNASTDTNYLKAGVKIDCETPGAVITYQVTNLYVTSDYNTNTSDYQRNIYAPDIMPSSVGTAASSAASVTPGFNNGSGLTAGSPSFDKISYTKSIEAAAAYSSAFYVGTGNADTGERIYIGAHTTSSIADLQQSDDVYEGAFKTVLHYNRMLASSAFTKKYNGNNFKIFACQTPEGVSYVAGWPLTMRTHFHQTTTESGTEDCYKVAYKDSSVDDYDYKWISWELLSEDFFTTTSVTWNFQIKINSLVTYGSYVWSYNVHTWGME